MDEVWLDNERLFANCSASNNEVPQRACQPRALMIAQRPPSDSARLEAAQHCISRGWVRPAVRLLESDQRYGKAARGHADQVWNDLGAAQGIERPVVGNI